MTRNLLHKADEEEAAQQQEVEALDVGVGISISRPSVNMAALTPSAMKMAQIQEGEEEES